MATKKKIAKKAKSTIFRIVMVVDRSGSMAGATLSDHIGGIKTFIKDQQNQVGETRFTLVQFDSNDPFEVLYDDVNVNDVNVEEVALVPRGGTPLLDAFGKTLAYAEEKETKKKSDKVIAVVITDGAENSSKEWTKAKLEQTVTEKQKAGWEFMFLGAGINAFADASSFGVSSGQVMNVCNSSADIKALYSSLSSHKINLARSLQDSCCDSAVVNDAFKYTAEDAVKTSADNSHIK